MDVIPIRLVVISHAGVKRINRSVYSLLKHQLADLKVVIPSRLVLRSQAVIIPDPPLPGEAEVTTMELKGTNPRKYFYPALPQWLNENKPDVILLENDPVSNLGIKLSKWCKENGAKFICQTYDNTPRNISATAKQQGLKAVPKNLLIHLLNYRMASRVHALFVVNRDSADIFRQYHYPNIAQIPLGYDRHVFFSDDKKRAAYRSKLQIDNETVLVAYFGRLVRQKGVHLVLQALSELIHLNWRLLLDHNHDSEDQYSSYIRNLTETLKLTGRVIYFDADHYEISNYMRASDIMVAPSVTTPTFKEQYGRAVQEAMACGCVCIVSDSGHPKDLLGEPRLVFEEGNPIAIRDLLVELISNARKRQYFSVALKKRAEMCLGTDSQVRKLRETIEMIALREGKETC